MGAGLPRAQYLVPAADDFHYGPDNAYGGGVQEVDRLVYEDSVAPVHRAGQAVLWEGHHRIDAHLTLESAPGHTPGSSVLRLSSGADRAVFVGDLLHSPVQILDPCHNSAACLDPEQAAASRRRILGRAAEERELLVPAHFGGAGALEVRGTARASPSARGRRSPRTGRRPPPIGSARRRTSAPRPPPQDRGLLRRDEMPRHRRWCLPDEQERRKAPVWQRSRRNNRDDKEDRDPAGPGGSPATPGGTPRTSSSRSGPPSRAWACSPSSR